MDEEFEGDDLDNVVILNDENGEEVRFEFLDLVELNDEEYVVLLPITEEGEEEEGEVVILKVEDTDDDDSDEESYVSVDDEEILNKIPKDPHGNIIECLRQYNNVVTKFGVWEKNIEENSINEDKIEYPQMEISVMKDDKIQYDSS